MNAILLDVSEAELEKTPEAGPRPLRPMWEGVPHKAPAPGTEHQRLKLKLWKFIDRLMEKTGRGRVAAQLIVFRNAAAGQD